MFWHNYTRGEVATTLTLITIAVLTLGVFAGTQLAQRNADTRSQAADFGTTVLQCDSGLNPYDSNTITITNNTDQTIEEMDSNVFRCKYEGPVNVGRYKCEDDCTGDGPDCQEGYWDPGASLLIQNLGPGQSITRTVEVGSCEIMQLDAYNKEVYQDDSPYECTNVRSANTEPPGNRFPGGLAFAIKANSNCSQPFQQPNGSAPLPVRDMGSSNASPTPNQTTQCSTEGGQCVTSPNDCQGSTLTLTAGKGCASYCCMPKLTPTPTSTHLACLYDNVGECNGLCGAPCAFSNGCFICPVDQTPTPTDRPQELRFTPTPTGTRTPTPTRSPDAKKTIPESCSDLSFVRTPTGEIEIWFQLSGTWHTVTIDASDKEFTFAEIGIDLDVTCPIP